MEKVTADTVSPDIPFDVWGALLLMDWRTMPYLYVFILDSDLHLALCQYPQHN